MSLNTKIEHDNNESVDIQSIEKLDQYRHEIDQLSRDHNRLKHLYQKTCEEKNILQEALLGKLYLG